MSITSSMSIALIPIRLQSLSAVRIPQSIHSFRNVLPSAELQPLKLGSVSSINHYGLNVSVLNYPI